MPDPNASPSITVEQAVFVAARILVAYLLLWAVDDFTLLPREVLAIAHYMNESGSVLGRNTALPETSYLQRSYILDFLANVLRMVLWLMAAGWFYRCGPRIRSFFAAGAE